MPQGIVPHRAGKRQARGDHIGAVGAAAHVQGLVPGVLQKRILDGHGRALPEGGRGGLVVPRPPLHDGGRIPLQEPGDPAQLRFHAAGVGAGGDRHRQPAVIHVLVRVEVKAGLVPCGDLHRFALQAGHERGEGVAKTFGKAQVRMEGLLDHRPSLDPAHGRRRQRGGFARIEDPLEVAHAGAGEELGGEFLDGGVGPAVEGEPHRRAAPGGAAVGPVLHLPVDRQDVGGRRDETPAADPDSFLPDEFHLHPGLLDVETLADLLAALVHRQVHGQLAHRLGAGIGTPRVGGPAVAQLLHPARVGAAPGGLAAALDIGVADPALVADAPGDFVDVSRRGGRRRDRGGGPRRRSCRSAIRAVPASGRCSPTGPRCRGEALRPAREPGWSSSMVCMGILPIRPGTCQARRKPRRDAGASDPPGSTRGSRPRRQGARPCRCRKWPW